MLRCGGHNRARTCDPLLVRQMLSQLSYAPPSIYQQQIVLYTNPAKMSRFFLFFPLFFSFPCFCQLPQPKIDIFLHDSGQIGKVRMSTVSILTRSNKYTLFSPYQNHFLPKVFPYSPPEASSSSFSSSCLSKWYTFGQN